MNQKKYYKIKKDINQLERNKSRAIRDGVPSDVIWDIEYSIKLLKEKIIIKNDNLYK